MSEEVQVGRVARRVKRGGAMVGVFLQHFLTRSFSLFGSSIRFCIHQKLEGICKFLSHFYQCMTLFGHSDLSILGILRCHPKLYFICNTKSTIKSYHILNASFHAIWHQVSDAIRSLSPNLPIYLKTLTDTPSYKYVFCIHGFSISVSHSLLVSDTIQNLYYTVPVR